MVRRTFFPGSYIAFVGYFFMLVPYVIAISFASFGLWWALLIAPFPSYILYVAFSRYALRWIAIKDGHISASPSFTIIDQMQHRLSVKVADIVIADFGYAQGDSKGGDIYYGWDTPCLTLMLADNSVERIMLCGYTREQWKEIWETLLKVNGEILLDHDWNYPRWH